MKGKKTGVVAHVCKLSFEMLRQENCHEFKGNPGLHSEFQFSVG